MTDWLLALLCTGVGFAAGWLLARRGGPAAGEDVAGLQRRLALTEGTLEETRRQLDQRGGELAETQRRLQQEQQTRVAAETRSSETEKSLAEQKRLLQEAEQRLKEAFEALSARALRENNDQFARQAAEQVRPLQETLERYRTELRELENLRQSAYGRLSEQITQLAGAQQQLSRSTTELSTALRSPQVKGRWGEITLRRAVEAAGLSPHCDFVEQHTVASEDGGTQRPDLVVKLPGGRTIVVDAKAPTSSYLDAVEAGSAEAREAALAAHADAIRTHMSGLAGKAYWRQFEATPEFVVMFVPGESFFSAALEQNRELIEEGIRKKVILASPTTLIALLQAVAYGWQQQDVIEHAREIGDTARELFERTCTFADHLGKIGDSLRKAADAYNDAVGSWQRRVLPSGRRLEDMGLRVSEQKSMDLAQVEAAPRELPESMVNALSPKPTQPELGFEV